MQPIENPAVKCVDGVYNTPSKLTPFYQKLREKDINNAIVLCYHYRIFSKQSCLRKFTNSKIPAYQTKQFHDLWITDYNELQDETLLQKSIQKFGNKNDINVANVLS